MKKRLVVICMLLAACSFVFGLGTEPGETRGGEQEVQVVRCARQGGSPLQLETKTEKTRGYGNACVLSVSGEGNGKSSWGISSSYRPFSGESSILYVAIQASD
jgi:hypothetical protein